MHQSMNILFWIALAVFLLTVILLARTRILVRDLDEGKQIENHRIDRIKDQLNKQRTLLELHTAKLHEIHKEILALQKLLDRGTEGGG